MQYQNIPTVRLLIIAEILGLIAAELLPGRAAAFKRVWRHRKRSTTRQLLDIAPNCSVPRPAAAQLMLIDARYVFSRCLEALQMGVHLHHERALQHQSLDRRKSL